MEPHSLLAGQIDAIFLLLDVFIAVICLFVSLELLLEFVPWDYSDLVTLVFLAPLLKRLFERLPWEWAICPPQEAMTDQNRLGNSSLIKWNFNNQMISLINETYAKLWYIYHPQLFLEPMLQKSAENLHKIPKNGVFKVGHFFNSPKNLISSILLAYTTDLILSFSVVVISGLVYKRI